MNSALAPGFLIASPGMSDPRFAKSVILLAEANEDGALGFVINRTTPYTFADLADEIGVAADPDVRTSSVHYGGPVSPERGWILYRHLEDEVADEDDSVMEVGAEIRLAATLDVLGQFLEAEQSSPFRLLLGYAGWAPDQLETELAEGAWLPMDLDSELIFDTPVNDLWDEAVKRLGLMPGGFMMGGGAEA